MRAFVLACVGSALLAANLMACGPSTSAECSVCGDNACVDVQTDPTNCGACGVTCLASQSCVAGACVAGSDQQACDDPGATEDCYTGPSGTNGVAVCHGGTRRCLDNGFWSACEGEVTPQQDACGNGIDEDCDGQADNPTDEDGDGYTNCTGDCCDSTDEGCTNPAAVNPGAFEAPGNMLDDDCDGNVDNAQEANCDTGLVSNSTMPIDYAKAIDICQTATDTDGRWGVISARWLMPDGMGTPLADQHAIRPTFGSTTVRHGSSLAVLSTANAAAPGQTNPSYSDFQSTTHGQFGGFPQDFLAAHNGQLPAASGCPTLSGLFANDPVMLELKIRTPTNAKSFSMKINFMSAEFPEYVCTPFNDFFVVLLDSSWNGSPANPTDKNLAIYTSPTNQQYPVGVNLAYGNTGLFTVCQNGATGCADGVAGTINTCTSSAELAGTGMETATNNTDYNCSGSDQTGGGTGWLTTSGNVNPGETITLRIALWDTTDGQFDSVALIDDFQWSLDPSDPGTVIDVD